MSENSFISIKNSLPAGDLIGMMAGIRQLSKEVGKKVRVHQKLMRKGIGYKGASHPFHDEQGDEVTMNKYMFNMLKPLICAQDYIEDFVIYEGQEIEIDLDRAEMEVYTNRPLGSLNRWIFHVYPQMSCDLSKWWLWTDYCTWDKRYDFTDKIIINRTDRYCNYLMNYFFLKKYETHLIFSGMPIEHERFCKEWKLNIPLLQVNDFLELARTIESCKFFVGNQSVCFQIAEATKTPRLLEICPMMPNVIPVGENSFDAYHQAEMEYHFEKLFNLGEK